MKTEAQAQAVVALADWVGAHVRVVDLAHRYARMQGRVEAVAVCGQRLRVRVDGSRVAFSPWALQRLGELVPGATHINASVQEAYDGAELRPSMRPGAEDAGRLPSLMGSRRIWRDGRVEAAT